MIAPRIFCITAREAPVAAVIRRGPSNWCHVGRWDLERMEYEPGAWLHGVIYPQRCDVSPNGRWLCYFTLKHYADWPAGNAYIALSRLPWLSALAAWGIGSTWTRGFHFVDDTSVWPSEPVDEGDPTACRAKYGLAFTRAMSFAVEHRRGWSETAETPPRDPDDMWDERRSVVMEKPSPVRPRTRLLAAGWYAGFREMGPDRFGESSYSLDDGDGPRPLKGIQWADWRADGSLLVAAEGRLQHRDSTGDTVRWETDLSALSPNPEPPPAEARHW